MNIPDLMVNTDFHVKKFNASKVFKKLGYRGDNK